MFQEAETKPIQSGGQDNTIAVTKQGDDQTDRSSNEMARHSGSGSRVETFMYCWYGEAEFLLNKLQWL